jgi:hypothetical protein
MISHFPVGRDEVELKVRSYTTDLTLEVHYREPMLGLAQEEKRLPLVRGILKAFELRLDDVTFDGSRLSGNYIQFRKQYGASLLGVQLGLEETKANLFRVENQKQAFEIFGKLYPILDEIPIASTRMIINRHFIGIGDVNSFLKSLNPTAPLGFEGLLNGRGVFYNLRIPDQNLVIYITLVNSMFVANGLFLAIDNQFSAISGSLGKSADFALEKHNFILKELEITIED